MLTRRGFLIGAGGLLTAAFAKDAQSFISRTGQPLLASPAEVAETMYWYEGGEQGYLLTIGPWAFCPPPPAWREFFASEGIGHRTEPETHSIWEKHGISPEDYDNQVDGWFWETRFDLETGPCARAYRLLKQLDLGSKLRRGSDGPHLVFCEGDVANDDSRWVDARDELTLSFLQARLIDLKLPIRIAQGI
ncbi:hypothetical protein GCM10010869_28300 [Mesorhizobium tianshanense]|uniref:Uncharacterized protein n=1 Tax=Mesorhizobium tianshanense TaxID=39844 RepID=A0A562MMR2_9HYPH|nr:hypothetical protein [Mesorhizobium tianshanense]TWI21207.1 hypothetical protein IQ26_06883 [Mesorhizobium tianshanense]GLS37237.1 hypothetical protein GCM10010869_28300 [Mesorhizobium tianshanense]